MKGHKCKEIDWCICDQMADEPSEYCVKHGCGDWPPRCVICGKFMSIESRNMKGEGK